ncbi:unnamed protein product [Adineta steineri]|uniref:Uncharacterized protein n=1 Tax=Adineta steineri TaxID=433720 RepID=A0A818XT48_9BILA|nr:unnamed protein product [Adineta steineri]CAF3743417.1 unnamed protein product [Adineta steineri]
MAAATTEKPIENFKSRISELMGVLRDMQSNKRHYDGEKKRLEEKQMETETARTEIVKKATDIIAKSDELIKKLEGQSKTLQEMEENRVALVEKYVTDVNNVSDGRLKLVEYLDKVANLKRQIKTHDKRITELNKEQTQIEEETKITDEEQQLIGEISEAGKKTEASTDFLTETKRFHKQCKEEFEDAYSLIDSIAKKIKTNQEKLRDAVEKEWELEPQKKDFDKRIEQLEKNSEKTCRVELHPEEIKRIEDKMKKKIGEAAQKIRENKDKLEDFEKKEKKYESGRRELEKEIYKLEDYLNVQKNHIDLLLSEKITTLEDNFNIHDGKVKQFESQLRNQKETFDVFQLEKRRLEELKIQHFEHVAALQKEKDATIQAAETAENDFKKEQRLLLEIKQNGRKTQIDLNKSINEENQIKNYLDQMILEKNLKKSEMEAAEASIEHLQRFETGWKQIGNVDELKVFAENEVNTIQQAQQTFEEAQKNYENQQTNVKKLQELYDKAQKNTQIYTIKYSGILTSISDVQSKLEGKFKDFNKLKAEMDQSIRIYQNALKEYQKTLTSLKIIELQLEWTKEELETSERDLSYHHEKRSQRENEIKELRDEITKVEDDISKYPTNIRKKQRERDDKVDELLETINESARIKIELELLFGLLNNLINEQNAAEREKTSQRETSENLEEYKRQITILNQNISIVKTNVAELKRNKETLSNDLEQSKIDLIRRKKNYYDARMTLHSQNKKKETSNQNLELLNERLNEKQMDLKQLKNQRIEREKQIARIIILREKLSKTMNDEQKECDEKNTFIETTSKNLEISTENIQTVEKNIEEEEKNFNKIQEDTDEHQVQYDDNDRKKVENYQRLELIGTNLVEVQKQLRESQTESAEKFNEIFGITNIFEETQNH